MTAQAIAAAPAHRAGVAASEGDRRGSAVPVLVPTAEEPLPVGDFCPALCPVHGGYDWRRPPLAAQAAMQRGLYAAMGL